MDYRDELRLCQPVHHVPERLFTISSVGTSTSVRPGIVVITRRNAPDARSRDSGATDAEKPRPGKTGASAVCRCAVPTDQCASLGDITMPSNRMRPFYLNCNSYSGKLTTNCANPYARLSSAASRPARGLRCVPVTLR